HVYKMEHHHQNSQPPRTTTRNEVTMYIHHILRKYRTPQVGKIGNHFWYWKCRQHEQLQFTANWATAYQAATHHAHNHHQEPEMKKQFTDDQLREILNNADMKMGAALHELCIKGDGSDSCPWMMAELDSLRALIDAIPE